MNHRYKDRSSKTSKLAELESHRFARAMYRVMLYCELFYLPLNLDDIDAMEFNEPGVLEKIAKKRHAMLDEYPTSDLLEIRAVLEFLHGMISSVLDSESFERVSFSFGGMLLRGFTWFQDCRTFASRQARR
jgi:hypothetical protein